MSDMGTNVGDLTDAELDEICISVGAFNLDWTNRKASVNDQTKLAIGTRESLVSIGSPDIVSFSEVSGKGWIKDFEKSTKFTGAVVRGSYGYMYTALNPERYVLEQTIESGGGRYMGSVLYDVSSKKRHLHVGVHLPTKGDWKKHADLVSKFVDEYRTKGIGIDRVTIAGDFNAEPSRVVEHFSTDDLKFAITPTVFLPTTEAGNSIDNILSSEEFDFGSIIIDNKNDRFTHFPLAATTKK